MNGRYAQYSITCKSVSTAEQHVHTSPAVPLKTSIIQFSTAADDVYSFDDVKNPATSANEGREIKN